MEPQTIIQWDPVYRQRDLRDDPSDDTSETNMAVAALTNVNPNLASLILFWAVMAFFSAGEGVMKTTKTKNVHFASSRPTLK